MATLSIRRERLGAAARGGSTAVPRGAGVPRERLRLSLRLRRVLTDNPHARHFTVQHIIKALESGGAAPPAALFAAAGLLGAPDTAGVSGAVTSAAGASVALGSRGIHLPRSLLRRRVPRSSLALLIHGVGSVIESAEGALRERWTWVFHPVMTGALGLILFLLGLASMAPVVGGGVQHAASAFFIAVGLAERDGLAAVLGALAGLACLAVAVLSISSGRKLWARVKAWLLQCARKLRLNALARLLDTCCDGLGELLRLRWSGLVLILLSPGSAVARAPRPDHSASSAVRQRVRRVRLAAERSFTLASQADEP